MSIVNCQLSIDMKGLVIKNTGSWYTVRTDDGRDVESKVKGNFRLKEIRSTNPVSVGDRVDIDINKVLPSLRKSKTGKITLFAGLPTCPNNLILLLPIWIRPC